MLGTVVRIVPFFLSFLFFPPFVLHVSGHWLANFFMLQNFFFGLPFAFLPSLQIRSAFRSLIPNLPVLSTQGHDGLQRLGQLSKTL